MAGLKERTAGVLYSYDLIFDPVLRESLEQFKDKVVKNISSWPVPVDLVIDQVEVFTGLERHEVLRFYDFVRRNRIINLTPYSFRKIRIGKYGFEKDNLRAFFTLLNIYQENKDSLHGWSKYRTTVELAKESLGPHPLTGQLNEEVSEIERPPKPSERNSKQIKRKEQDPLEKIPIITKDQLRHMVSFDEKKNKRDKQ